MGKLTSSLPLGAKIAGGRSRRSRSVQALRQIRELA